MGAITDSIPVDCCSAPTSKETIVVKPQLKSDFDEIIERELELENKSGMIKSRLDVLKLDVFRPRDCAPCPRETYPASTRDVCDKDWIDYLSIFAVKMRYLWQRMNRLFY